MEIKHGITIDKNELDDDVSEAIREDLIVVNPIYQKAVERGNRPVIKDKFGNYRAIPQYVYFLREYDNRIEIPLGYTDKLVGLVGPLPELIYKPIVINDLSGIKLRPYQDEAVNSMLQANTGILCSPAASGKTVMAMAIIRMLGLKTLWIVHRGGLARQAAASYEKFFGEKAGVVGDKSWIIGNTFTAGVTNTVAAKSRDLLKEEFDLIIVDEVHRAPTAMTFNALIGLSPKILYGLSATPFREDNLQDVLYNLIGPIRHEVPREELERQGYIVTPSINLLKTDIAINLDSLEKVTFGSYLHALEATTERTMLVATEVITYQALGYSCVVLCEYVSYCELIYNLLSELVPNVAIIHGRNKKIADELPSMVANKEIDIICTTYKYFSDGFDLPELAGMFFGTPFKSKIQCEQVIGRIQRICINKKSAKVIDFIDDDPIAKNHLAKRLDVYSKLNCKWEYTYGKFENFKSYGQ